MFIWIKDNRGYYALHNPTIRADMNGNVYGGGGDSGGGGDPPEMSAEEKELYAQQASAIKMWRKQLEYFAPIMQAQMGFKEVDGKMVKMSPDEMAEVLTPQQMMAYENVELWTERTQLALKGELPLTEAGQHRKQKEFETFKEAMGRKGIEIFGDTLEEAGSLSTPGIQSLESFKKYWGAQEEAERYGQLGMETGVGFGQPSSVQQYLGITGQQYGGLAQGYAGIAAPYAQQRGYQTQANIAAEGRRAQTTSSLYQGIGTIAGSGISAYILASALSSKKYKEAIKNLSDKEKDKLIKMFEDIPVYNWKYKGTKKTRLGTITEEAPKLIVMEDDEHLDVISYLGLLTLAVKELLKEKREGK
jgi:hypothetical protein